MNAQELIVELEGTQRFFNRSIGCLEEADSNFVPVAGLGLMTTAQHVAHVAQTVEWFMEGAFRPEGFDLDFAAHAAIIAKVQSLAEARRWSDRAFEAARKGLLERTPEELAHPLPDGPIMGGQPRFAIVSAIADHTAHHRGALTVYARLCGRTPDMPYM